MKRLFTPYEVRGLSEVQKDYLQRHLNVKSLQPSELARHALYQTKHGAVTIDRAMELDRLQSKHQSLVSPRHAIIDTYSQAEDNFIDQHGISSALF